MAEKLNINRCISALNNKSYDFYKKLTEEEKKQFSLFVFLRWISSPENLSDREYGEHLIRLNNIVNKNFFLLSKDHPDLIWKLFVAVNRSKKNLRYSYFPATKKEKVDKFEKILVDAYPHMKIVDIRLLNSLMTKEEKKELLNELGLDKKQQKEYI